MTSQLTYPSGIEQIFKSGSGYATVYGFWYEWIEVRSSTDVYFVWGINGLKRDASLFVSAGVNGGEPE